MAKYLFALPLLLQVACATIHNGAFAEEGGEITEKQGLRVSGSESTALSSKHFLPLDFTIENMTDHWIVIESAALPQEFVL